MTPQDWNQIHKGVMPTKLVHNNIYISAISEIVFLPPNGLVGQFPQSRAQLSGGHQKSDIVGNWNAQSLKTGRSCQKWQCATKTVETLNKNIAKLSYCWKSSIETSLNYLITVSCLPSQRRWTILALLTVDDPDLIKISFASVWKWENWNLTEQRKRWQILMPTTLTLRRLWQKKWCLPELSLPNIIIRLSTVGKRCLYIPTGHVEYENCRESTFALLALLIAVQFCVGTDKPIFSPCRMCFKNVLNRLANVLKVLKTVIVTTSSTNVSSDSTTNSWVASSCTL